MDPYTIFASARAVWQAANYPQFLTYTVRISGESNGRVITNTYASSFDSASSSIAVHATSAEEAAAPQNANGVAFHVKLSVGYASKAVLGVPPTVDGPASTVRVSRDMRVTQPDQYDVLGVPMLTPTYSFGLAFRAADLAASPAPASSLPTIASVTAQNRRYDVVLAGDAVVDGRTCYRLQLTPRYDPAINRLRELWVDEATYATLQAVTDGNFTAGPGPTLEWMIHFTTVDGRPYIADETALEPVRYLGHTYTNVHVAFDNVAVGQRFDKSWIVSLFKTSGDVLTEPKF